MKVLDLFAGLGGSSVGYRTAGWEVLLAANHCPKCVHWHGRNFPGTRHVCQDLNLANFYDFPDADCLGGSPSCKGNTPARGKEQEHHDAERATAWCVTSAVEAKRPQIAIVENVLGMRNWPLYPAWKSTWEALGYSYAEFELNASRFKVPQDRVRLIGVATRSKHPIELKFQEHPPLPVKDLIQWDRYAWSLIADKVANTRARVAAARLDLDEDVFVMPYYGSGSGKTGRSIDRPLGTLTTKARWAVVRGNEMRMIHPEEAKLIMGFPADYLMPKNVELANRMLGNAVPPPMMAEVARAIQEAA